VSPDYHARDCAFRSPRKKRAMCLGLIMSLPVSLLPPVPLRSRLFSFHALISPPQMYHIAKTMPLTLYNGINGLVSLSGTSLLPGAFCLKPGPP
jgi:hypothetical protein